MATSTTMVRRETGINRYASGETDLVITAPTYKSGGPLIIYCHGAGQTPDNLATYAASSDLEYLAYNLNAVVVVASLGGINTWVLDSVVHPTTGFIKQLITWAAGAPYLADTSRIALIGDSMGGQNAAIAYRLATSTFKCAVLRSPVVAAAALHDRHPSGLRPLMDRASGGTAAAEAAVPSQGPYHANQTAVLATVKHRIRIYYSSNDPTILPADVTSFCAATGVKAYPTGANNHAPTVGIHARSQA